MLKYIKFLFQYFLSSRYVVQGKCNGCGDCCRNIVFYIGEKIVSEEEDFLKLQNFNKKYKNFEIFKKGEKGELLFKCKSLRDDGSCKDYKWRSLDCRLYPQINQKFVYDGGKPLDNCGYSFSVNKKFKDYLDKND